MVKIRLVARKCIVLFTKTDFKNIQYTELSLLGSGPSLTCCGTFLEMVCVTSGRDAVSGCGLFQHSLLPNNVFLKNTGNEHLSGCT